MQSAITNRDIKPLYVINGHSNGLQGNWTPEGLAAALREPLAAIGVRVEARPKQWHGGGLLHYGFDGEAYKASERVVAEVVAKRTARGS